MLERLLDAVTRNLAFYPPQPPTYKLARHGDGHQELYIQPLRKDIKKVPQARVELVPGAARGGGDIVVVHVPAPLPGTRFTLLHSHGNAVDLGDMLPFYEQLARALRANVVAYDYAGYGASAGLPAVSAAHANLEAVFRWVVERQGREPRDIVLYGQSIGSGPTCHAATRLDGIAGVVLHSPFLSGMRVLKPGWSRWPAWLDIFPNYKLVPRIQAPTLVMHGTEDAVIGIAHGRRLHELCRRPAEPLFADGYSHHNLELSPEYLPRLRAFLAECYGADYRPHVGPGR